MQPHCCSSPLYTVCFWTGCSLCVCFTVCLHPNCQRLPMGADPHAASMLSVHWNSLGTTIPDLMLGFHGDTGNCQTVMCLPEIFSVSAMGPLCMCVWEHGTSEGRGKCFRANCHINIDCSTTWAERQEDRRPIRQRERQQTRGSQNTPETIFEYEEEAEMSL